MFRIKATLRSGEMQVPGDQWPIFIYARCEYDPEDAWKGAFRSAILIAVSETQSPVNQTSKHIYRHINIYLLRQVL